MRPFSAFSTLFAGFIAGAQAVTLTSTSSSYTVSADSTNALSFTVSKSNCDVTSIIYRGTQMQYQGGSYSQIGSGLGSATVAATTLTCKDLRNLLSSTNSSLDNGVNYVKITCSTSTLIHYMVVRDGDSSIHMATYTSAEPTVGELRWIARLIPATAANDDVNEASNTAGGTAIEASDVYKVGSQTRSKFYSSQRFIEDQVHCFTGVDSSSSTIKTCMIMPGTAYETSSGGPFFRDINTNAAGTTNNLYFYMAKAFRTGLHGPYVMSFTRSGTPSGTVDLSFWAGMGATGYVATSARGTVVGKAGGIDATKYPIVVHWYNSAAQYWTTADASTRDYSSPAMKPGTYTMVLYQDELLVATSSVTVSAGAKTSKNIDSTWTTGSTTLFQIGDWDGQPTGFRNAANQLRMHPSDARMSSWGPLTYTVGSSALTDFPMAIFKSVNTPLTIKFTLTAAQAAAAATLRVGTTLAFAGARPVVVLNSKTFATPAAPVAINSRGVTRGAYRGRGEIYNFAVAAGDLVTGTNTITINVASGSSGANFLEPNFIFDAVHLFR
ncbi:galactose mutarotase-like protein [Coleophoma cylindrospora]|uniref:rhamnogalacturonan endolyase n=1 Tax=Coleophoma cylindrospora TaxID=1849047 RepID=A0A3D8RHU6_9HELO|nr:galactose mutarotase-like protein [Coleophoma cylindrospora]